MYLSDIGTLYRCRITDQPDMQSKENNVILLAKYRSFTLHNNRLKIGLLCYQALHEHNKYMPRYFHSKVHADVTFYYATLISYLNMRIFA